MQTGNRRIPSRPRSEVSKSIVRTIGANRTRGMLAVAVLLTAAQAVRAQQIYDFSSGAGTTNTAFKDRVSAANIPPLVNTTPSNAFTAVDYGNVASSNNSYYDTGSIGSGNRAAARFVFTVTEPESTVIELGVSWEGHTVAGGTIRLYAWNATTSVYTQIGTSTSATDATISGTVSPPGDYIDGNGQVTVLVLNSSNNAGVATDYVRIGIKQCNSAADCTDDGNVCTTTVCSSNLCGHENNAISCDDGNACTRTDTCQGGTCIGLDPVECTPRDQCHNAGACDPLTGLCSNPAKAAGTPCEDGLFCTENDVCVDGVCQGSLVDCGHLDDQCLVGLCREETAGCRAYPAPEGQPCDDGLFCTVGEACLNGTCVGGPRDCSTVADQCNFGLCNETEDRCVAEPVANGSDCDDGNACNAGEACENGQCTGGSAVSCPQQSICNEYSCDPAGAEGNCDRVTPLPDNTPCDDKFFCTLNACVAGECVVTGPTCPLACDEAGDACVECVSDNQCNDNVACTEDRCTRFTCAFIPQDANCPDDNLFCNGTEVCDAALGCVSTGDPCPQGQFCNEDTDTCGACLIDEHCGDSVGCTADRCIDGGCVYVPDDRRCLDDGLFCNGGERCALEGCFHTGDPCPKNRYCNEETDACDECQIDDHCEDGNPCTVDHACVLGTCQAGVPVDCSQAGTQCRVASCDPSGAPGNCDVVVAAPHGSPCDDGLLCTTDHCENGQCVGVLRDCSHLDDQCNVGECDFFTGECVVRAVKDGAACDDQNFCTVGDVCTGGVCGGSLRDCSHLDNQCEVGVCDEAADACVRANRSNGTPCDDGLPCTIGDACSDGFCLGEFRDCTDPSDQCGLWACDFKTGECVRTVFEDGHGCNDGLFCTFIDSCQAGVCTGTGSPCFDEGQPYCNEELDHCDECQNDNHCGDGVDCTRDACEDGQCVSAPDDELCADDGLFCNGQEYCDALAGCLSTGDPCIGTDRLYCDEQADACQECLSAEHCDDADPCTVDEACIEGSCQAGVPVDCSAIDTGAECRVAACDPAGSAGNCDAIVEAPNGSSCDDGLFCTVEDACFGGVCGGFARDCRAVKDQCNLGVCDEDAKGCVPRPVDNGTSCNDGNVCTDFDICLGGVCSGQEPRDLSGWLEMHQCLGGPDAGLGGGCECFDLHDDGHVDLKDVSAFMNGFASE